MSASGPSGPLVIIFQLHNAIKDINLVFLFSSYIMPLKISTWVYYDSYMKIW